jgi:hypothetical protein
MVFEYFSQVPRVPPTPQWQDFHFSLIFHCLFTTADKCTPEPVFVNLLRSPGIDSQPGRQVREPYLSYRSARLHRLAESIPQILGLLKRLQFTNSGSGISGVEPREKFIWGIPPYPSYNAYNLYILQICLSLTKVSTSDIPKVNLGFMAKRSSKTFGGFIKDEYCSWVQYKSGPGGRPSM